MAQESKGIIVMEATSSWHLLFILVFILFNLPAYWVFRKAGWSGWWFLLLSIPLFGVIVLYIFAFRRWPIERQGDASQETV